MQSQTKFILNFSNDNYKQIKRNPEYKFKDSISLIKYLKDFKIFAIKRGFLTASIDSLIFINKSALCNFYVGEKFNKAQINIDEEHLKFIRKKGKYKEKEFKNVLFRPYEISKILNNILKLYENNSFPFCKLHFRKIDIQNGVLFADLIIEEGPSIKINKIHLPGDKYISESFLYSYLQIKEGDLYNQEKIQNISPLLKQISFLEETKPSEILFTKDGAELYIYLKAKPVSLINGVVGLQPNNSTNLLKNSNAKKYFFTGELRLKLLNSLRMAELFDLEWKSIQAQTQNMKIHTNFPNLFKTPFGIDAQFQLYKRDTTFLELKLSAGINYTLNNGSILKLIYKRYTSNILRAGYNNTSFSNLSNIESNYYGLGYSKQVIDYLPNPRKGYFFQVEAIVGQRINKDSTNFKKSNTIKFELNIQKYLIVKKRFILKLSNFSEVYIAPNYFENEVYRFGGQNTLRGFNEEEIFATSRSVFTFEPRFLLDKNSYLFIFYDQAWYENKAKKYVHDTPYGFGLGFTFGTTLGNFAISYGLGSQFKQDIKFKDGKIHFGYVAYF